jgi:hypothetical protein
MGGGWSVLKLAADSREAAQGKGVRCLTTSMLRSTTQGGTRRHQ